MESAEVTGQNESRIVTMIVGIAAKPTTSALDKASRTIEFIESKGHGICIDDDTAKNLGHHKDCAFPKRELASKADLLITFGGDGTLLSVARHAPQEVPIMGVNMGTLGFLTEIRVEEFDQILENFLEGRAVIEPRGALDVTIRYDSGNEESHRVMNDAVVNKGALARIIEMWVEIGGSFVSAFRADGLIVATPTGSTAYNLSAGGPVIYPTVEAIVVTPICPHMLTNRSIVLPDHLKIEINLREKWEEVFLTLDGQEAVSLDHAERVIVQKSTQTISLVQSPDKDYFQVLRQKLKWGEERERDV